MVDGGTFPPPQPPLYSFQPRPLGTTENCKETIFLPENGIFLTKNRCGRAVHAAATDFICLMMQIFQNDQGGAVLLLFFPAEVVS